MSVFPLEVAFAERALIAPSAAALIGSVLAVTLLCIGPLPQAARALRRLFIGRSTVGRRIDGRLRSALRVGVIAGTALGWFIAGGAGALAAALVAVCLLLSLCDLRWRWLPTEWTASILASGVLLAFAAGQGLDALIDGATLAAGLLAVRQGYWAIRGEDGLGLGDVVLAAGISAHLGLETGLIVLICACAIGVLAATASQWGGLTGGDRSRSVPLGVYLAMLFAAVPSFSILM